MPSREMSGEDLLALYRRRGKAEGHLDELMSVVAPALSSTSCRKSHYWGRKIARREKGVDPCACNRVRLLLAGFGYQIMHVQRTVLERVTGTGWSLGRLAERVLRNPGALHRLGSLRHRNHRRRLGALAHARLRARDPARALRIAPTAARHRPLPRPRRPQGRRGVSNRRKPARSGPKTYFLRTRNARFLAPGTAPTRPRGIARGLSAPNTSVHE